MLRVREEKREKMRCSESSKNARFPFQHSSYPVYDSPSVIPIYFEIEKVEKIPMLFVMLSVLLFPSVG